MQEGGWGGESNSDFSYESEVEFVGFGTFAARKGADAQLPAEPAVAIEGAHHIVNTATWLCDKCFYDTNKASSDECVMCGTSRRVEKLPEGVDDAALRTESAMWQCAKCTLCNPDSAIQCSACDSFKPGAVPELPKSVLLNLNHVLEKFTYAKGSAPSVQSPAKAAPRTVNKSRHHTVSDDESDDSYYADAVNSFLSKYSEPGSRNERITEITKRRRQENVRAAMPAKKKPRRRSPSSSPSNWTESSDDSHTSAADDTNASVDDSGSSAEDSDNLDDNSDGSSDGTGGNSSSDGSADSGYSTSFEKTSKKTRTKLRSDVSRDTGSRSEVAAPKLLSEADLHHFRASRLDHLLTQTAAIMQKLNGIVTAIRQTGETPGRASTEPEAECISPTRRAYSGSLSCLTPPSRKPATASTPVRHHEIAQPSGIVGTMLHKYQLEGVAWLRKLRDARLNGILADEMGLGKTIQVLALMLHLWEECKISGPHLVVAPLSVVHSWQGDIERFAPSLKPNVFVYRGEAVERKKGLQQFLRPKNASLRDVCAPSLVLTTYEMVLRDAPQFQRVEWDYIIIDEGHRIKNVKAKLGHVLRRCRSDSRLLLSGTPLQNNLNELWSLLNFCLPKLFNSLDNFLGWFAAPFASSVVVRDGHAIEVGLALSPEEERAIISRLQSVLKPFLLRRVKADVLKELPSKTEVVLLCPLSALQAAMYERTLLGFREYIDPATGKVQRQFSMTNAVMRLRQICNHPYLLAHEWQVNEDLMRSSGKFDVLSRLIPKLVAAGHRLLIFSQMTTVLDLLEDVLDMLGVAFARLDGSTKAEAREDAISGFNTVNSEVPVFLLSTRAGGAGINLQAADTVILFDSDWNPQQDLQAQARAHRIGQTKTVKVIRLVSRGPPKRIIQKKRETSQKHWRYIRSVEEIMYVRALQKLRAEHAVIGMGDFRQSSTITVDHKSNKATIMHDILSAIMADPGTTYELDGFVASMDGEMPAVSDDTTRRDWDRGMFAGIRNDILNDLAARDDDDKRQLALWDIHCDAIKDASIKCACTCGEDPLVYHIHGCAIVDSPDIKRVSDGDKRQRQSPRLHRTPKLEDAEESLVQFDELPDDLKKYIEI